MPNCFALRQVAFATRDLAATRELLLATGGWSDVGQDRHAEVFDLTSHLFQNGSAFVEVLVPTAEGTPLTRFLDKHAERDVVPYMLLLQDVDPAAGQYDLVPQEWRVHATQRPGYRSMHISPKVAPPLLIALAQPQDETTWPLTERLIGRALPPGPPTYRTIHIEADTPDEVAQGWADLLAAPVTPATDGGLRVDGALLSVEVHYAPGRAALTGLSLRLPRTPSEPVSFAGVDLLEKC